MLCSGTDTVLQTGFLHLVLIHSNLNKKILRIENVGLISLISPPSSEKHLKNMLRTPFSSE